MTSEQKKFLDKRVEGSKLTQQDYLINKIFDSIEGLDSRRRTIVQLLPDYYKKVNQIGDIEIKKALTDFGGNLWRVLK